MSYRAYLLNGEAVLIVAVCRDGARWVVRTARGYSAETEHLKSSIWDKGFADGGAAERYARAITRRRVQDEGYTLRWSSDEGAAWRQPSFVAWTAPRWFTDETPAGKPAAEVKPAAEAPPDDRLLALKARLKGKKPRVHTYAAESVIVTYAELDSPDLAADEKTAEHDKEGDNDEPKSWFGGYRPRKS